VLTVGNMYPPHHTGGYELVWRAAVERLRGDGHQVRVLTTDHRGSSVEPDDADVYRELRWYWRDHAFPARGLIACLALERHNLSVLQRHLDELRPDVVAWWSMGGMSLSLLEQARRGRVPAVAFVHDDWVDYARRTDGWYRRFRRRPRRARLAERLLGVPTRVDFPTAARYVFVSETTRARALMAGVAMFETAIAHSGIDSSFLSLAPERDWSWELLYVGRIDPRKGIDTAVDALNHLPPEARLTVIGEGDPRERERLVARISRAGLTDRVLLVGGRERSMLRESYAAADAVLFPVTWPEPWGLVPLEAMAVGRPVVATGRGGSGEYLRDGHNCLLFEGGDPVGLADAVRRLSNDPDLRSKLRQAGFASACEHTEERFNDAVVAALMTAADQRPRTSIPHRPGHSDVPRLSVVIPTQARFEVLSRTLDALEAQDLRPGEFEVIVVGDPEQDSDRLDAAVGASERPYAARWLLRSSHAVGAARNVGWRAARAPVALFLGDDILGSRTLLAEHVAWHERYPDERIGVLGAVDWARELTVTPFMRWLEGGLQFDYASIDGIDAGFGHFYTANISVKRTMLELVGGFDEVRFPFAYEDIDLGYRLAEAGFQLLYNRRADAEHLHPSTIEQWRRRMAATAVAERKWVALHPELEAYFHDRMVEAASLPPRRGRAEQLVRFTPRWLPWLGDRVWDKATVSYLQQLAPAFLESWAAQEDAAPPSAASASSAAGPLASVGRENPAGSPPGGPK
jgi:glycogen(starch) synthase